MNPLLDKIEYLDLKFYISKIKDDEVIILLEKLARSMTSHLNLIKKSFPDWKDDDIRIRVFTKSLETLSAYKVDLYYALGMLVEINNFNNILLPSLAPNQVVSRDDLQAFHGHFSRYITFGFFHVFFSTIESSIRIFIRPLKIKNKKGVILDGTGSITEIWNYLIPNLDINEDYASLLILLALIRNCIHNRSFYFSPRGNQEVKYKGKTYKFVQGKHIDFDHIKIILELFFDIDQMFFDIVNSKKISKITYLADIFG
jgi:hypothetical protein